MNWEVTANLAGSTNWQRGGFITSNLIRIESSVPQGRLYRGIIAKSRQTSNGIVYSEFKKVWSDPGLQTFVFLDDMALFGAWQIAWKCLNDREVFKWSIQVDQAKEFTFEFDPANPDEPIPVGVPIIIRVNL